MSLMPADGRSNRAEGFNLNLNCLTFLKKKLYVNPLKSPLVKIKFILEKNG